MASIEQDLVHEVAEILKACRAAVEILDGKLKNVTKITPISSLGKLETHARRALYPFKASTLTKIHDIFSDLRENLILLLSVVHPDTASVDRIKLNDVSAGIASLKPLLEQVKLKEDIKRWLNAPGPSSNFNTTVKKRELGTGEWFITGSSYLQSLRCTNMFLWLHGAAGCGKTVLTSTVSAATRLACNDRADLPVLSYYFDFNDLEEQSVEDMLRAHMRQLSSMSEESCTWLEEFYVLCESGFHSPPPKSGLLH